MTSARLVWSTPSPGLRRLGLLAPLLVLSACGEPTAPIADGGVEPPEPPPIVIERSLFWADAVLLDDPSVVSFAKLMALASRDGHGGALLSQWFHRFATTAHSERALPAQFIDAVAAQQGADPTRWDLSRLPFKVTGVHNRIDLAELTSTGHCGELRASVSCTDVTLQPFHALFLFRQPLGDGDVVDGHVTCEGTARRWAELSTSESDALHAELRRVFDEGFTRQRFLMLETVEFSLAPWEWRQWVPDVDGALQNPALFQQLDVERLNLPGALRSEFLAWVDGNAEALAQRRLLIPERFRTPSTRITQGVPRVPLSLDGSAAAARDPTLRAQLELVGCAACHTADAEFVQTRTDRTVSPFYEKELKARAEHLAAMARGEAPSAPFGPLQAEPLLPH